MSSRGISRAIDRSRTEPNRYEPIHDPLLGSVCALCCGGRYEHIRIYERQVSYATRDALVARRKDSPYVRPVSGAGDCGRAAVRWRRPLRRGNKLGGGGGGLSDWLTSRTRIRIRIRIEIAIGIRLELRRSHCARLRSAPAEMASRSSGDQISACLRRFGLGRPLHLTLDDSLGLSLVSLRTYRPSETATATETETETQTETETEQSSLRQGRSGAGSEMRGATGGSGQSESAGGCGLRSLGIWQTIKHLSADWTLVFASLFGLHSDPNSRASKSE